MNIASDLVGGFLRALKVIIAAALAVALAPRSAEAVDLVEWTCEGVCGGSPANGIVPAPPDRSTYGWVATRSNSPRNLELPGVGGIGAGQGAPTTGTRIRSPLFQASSGQPLTFFFNYVTSDGGTYADYGWVRLLNASGDPVALLFTARTTQGGNTVPGFSMPVPTATLSPSVNPIRPGGPQWTPLGTDSGRCFRTGCGYTGWIQSSYTVPTAGAYRLEIGTVNWADEQYQSGIAFSTVSIGGTAISDVAQAIASETGACQTAAPGAAFPLPLGIVARTASGAPAANVAVSFVVTAFQNAGATLSASSVTTDSSGRARVNATANGVTGGPYVVTARLANGAPTTFKLVNLAGAGTRPVCDGEPLRALAPTAQQPLTFAFRVDANTPRLRVVTSGGTGNANLRVQLAQAATGDPQQLLAKNTLCDRSGPSNEEECIIDNPTPGSWTAVVSSPSSASNVDFCPKCSSAPQPETVRLQKDQAFTLSPSTLSNESRRFFIIVPEGARGVSVRTGGGSGNANLLTRFGEPPFGTRVDCTRTGPTNDETCALGDVAGTLYIEVRGAPNFSGLTLTASWTEPPPPSVGPVTAHDLNGDGYGDLLWRNGTAGRSYAQLRTPNGVLSEGDLFVSNQWRVTHSADINGNGRADTLWYNDLTGESYYWVSDTSGVRAASQATLLRDPNWRITHTGDFNADGTDDLLWNRADTGETHVWLMLAGADGVPFAPVGFRRTLLVSREWNVVATGDIDNDGTDDLIWFNSVTGETVYWHMSGLVPFRQGTLLVDRNWFVVAAGDLDADGRSELLWYNPILRNNYYWSMNFLGTGPASQGTLLIHPEWRITGTTDVDGDRRDDLLWRNDATGESFLWYMNGPVPVRQQSLLVNPAWRVINR
jgi:hypothetical protein